MTADGSNYHAVGMLDGLRQIAGEENVLSFPGAEDGSAKLLSESAVLRFLRKRKPA